MGIFRRKSQEAHVTPLRPVVESVDSVMDTIEQRRQKFENEFKAGAYVADLLAEADEKIMDFYNDAKSRRMKDEDILEAVRDAVLVGRLPMIAERIGPPRGGIEPIYFVDTLPEEDRARIAAYIGEEGIKVVTFESDAHRTLRDRDEAIIITPRQAVGEPRLRNSRSMWTELVTKLEGTVRGSENTGSHTIEE
jgi:hypothetical protein